ncbi:MAG: SDR family NAD(P)-dependent oxidoreductase [Lysobacter sp.]
MSAALVILGATGGVGRGVVRAALDRGHPVVAVARQADALAALAHEHHGADVVTLPGSVASDAEGAALAERLRDLRRPFAGIVTSVCGGTSNGRVLDQPAEFLRRKLDEDLLPHLAAARHLLPLLAEAGRGNYLLIGGPGSENPWAGYGHRSVAAAALRMLARVLHDEARALDVRVNLLTVDMPACTGHNRKHASSRWPSALAIGQQAVALIERPPPDIPVVRYAPPTKTGPCHASPSDNVPAFFGPDSAPPPSDSCTSLVAVRALLGRFSSTGSKKDISS